MIFLLLVSVRFACNVEAYSPALHEEPSRPRGDFQSAALAFEGGGFRALSSDAGFIAGLLAVYGRLKHMQPPTLAGSGLLSRFNIISSASGSSWFISELVFSDRFRALIEGISDSPTSAAWQFGKCFTQPWLRATGVDDRKFKALLCIAHRLGVTIGVTEDTEMAIYFTLTGLTWNHFVDVLLNSTGGMHKSLPLGHPLADGKAHWANGKVWLVDHSTLFPPENKKQAQLFGGRFTALPRVSYYVESSAELPIFVPAVFSIQLGAGNASSAPVPYTASFVTESLERLKYRGVVVPVLHEFAAESSRLGADFGRNFVQDAGMLPVSRVLAASSAFMGSIVSSGPLPERITSLLSGDFTPWASSAPSGKSFSVADTIVRGLAGRGGVSRHSTSALASVAVHGVIDGGFTDGTGISQAVAAGAVDVLAILNSNSINDPLYIQRLFPGGLQPIPEVASLFPVFASPSASAVQKSFESFQLLALPEDRRFLRTFAVGTILASTIENKLFGVRGGQTVTLNIVNIGSALTIGSQEDFNNYNTLVQEIVSTLTSEVNLDSVKARVASHGIGNMTANLHVNESLRGRNKRWMGMITLSTSSSTVPALVCALMLTWSRRDNLKQW